VLVRTRPLQPQPSYTAAAWQRLGTAAAEQAGGRLEATAFGTLKRLLSSKASSQQKESLSICLFAESPVGCNGREQTAGSQASLNVCE